MSMTQADFIASERASYGGFIDAVGGIATIVLAIVGLTGLAPSTMLGIVTIIFGAALLIQGGAMLTEYARIIFPAGTTSVSVDQFGGGSLSALFLVGAAGIVLGLLALLGINPTILTSVAVIAFGSALILSSNSVLNLHVLKASAERPATQSTHTGSEILAAEMASGSAGIQAIAGLAAIVLGILAVVGTRPDVLSLVALLALGATLILTGTTLSGVVLSFMRPMETSRS
jgi:hypothetical protein